MRSETNPRRAIAFGWSVTVSATLVASSASPQSAPSANAQDELHESCVETHVEESMVPGLREAISEVCRENAVFVTQLMARVGRCERECAMGRAAVEWAKSQGFEECLVDWTRTTQYKDVLIVVKPGITTRRMWTQDVPFGLSQFSLPKGPHLCKWSLIGGPSAVIDSHGSEVDFFLTDWVES